MRLTLGLISALALTAGLAACKAPSHDGHSHSGDVMQSNKVDGFERTLTQAKTVLDAAMAGPVTIPTPKDPGGGYTHETHKANFALMYDAGQLYQLTGEKKYAEFAGQMMLDYAKVYPSWGIHPAKKEQSPGRMFWQNLNESMFLLHVSQSYAAVKETLSDQRHSTKSITTEHGQRPPWV